MKQKRILTFTLAILLLSACQPVVIAPNPAVVERPAQMSTPTAFVEEVKEVSMVTQTPTVPTSTPEISLPTADPNLPTPTSTSVGLPKTLEQLGIPATTYQDDAAGLAFDYPSGWIINALTGDDLKNALAYTTSLRSRDVKPGPKQQEGIPADMAAIDVTVVKNGPKTYAQAVNERRANMTTTETGQPVVIAVEEEWTLRGGLQAHRFLLNLGKDPAAGPESPDKLVSELVTMIDGNMILVTGYGDLSLFNVVAASLREIN